MSQPSNSNSEPLNSDTEPFNSQPPSLGTLKVASIAIPKLESPTNRFYRTVWRWHFYAGLFVIPFMLVLAITGSIYLFKPQLDAVLYANQLFVQPTHTLPQSASQQLAVVQQAYPDVTVTKFTPAIAPDRSTEISLTTPSGQNLTVFVNPYTAKVLGDRNDDTNFQAIVRKIHGELMIGKLGDYLIELAACWGLVLLITGLYLWLPRQGWGWMGSLIPRFWHENRRIVWRDLHAVSGFYGALLIGFLILTGLPWSGFWGETFAKVWDQFPRFVFSDPPQSTVLTGVLNQQGTQTVPWAVERLPLPKSHLNHDQSQKQKEQAGQAEPTRSLSKSGQTVSKSGQTVGLPVTLDRIVAFAQAQQIAAGFSVSLPQDKTGVYTVSVFPDNPAGERTLHIDRYSGQVLADVGWQDYALVPKAVELGIAIHMGKYFGIANQLLMLLACLMVILLCLSGTVLWWHRRPSGRIGAPAPAAARQPWKLPLVLIALLGVLFPLVGISLVAVLMFDYLVLNRIPALKRLFN